MQQTFLAIFIGVIISIDACATPRQAVVNDADPYEHFNRKMFVFNGNVDDFVGKPISTAYKWITPQFMQTGVSNFFNNLKNVNVVINDVLQAKFSQSAEDTGRFAINSTVGLGGLFDIAKKVGLEQNEEDFDQTLAVWGVPQGSYLVLPFLGPSTARGVPGTALDTATNPANYLGAPITLMSISMLNTRANAEGSLKFIDEAALDPYVFTRESFLQWRNQLATDGKAKVSSDLDLDLDALEDPLPGSNKGSASGEGQGMASKTSFVLRLDAKTKEFGQISSSFSRVAQSFNDTAKSFEESGNKLNNMKELKKY